MEKGKTLKNITRKLNISISIVSKVLDTTFLLVLNSIDFTDFGNLPLFDYLDHKPIASVKEDFHEVGRQAAELLFQMIKGDNDSLKDHSQNVEIPCKLIIHKN